MVAKETQQHIMHIIPTLRYGGAERVVVDISNRLIEKGFRVSILTFFDDVPLATELDSRISHIVVKKRGKVSLDLVSQLTQVMKGLAPDLVHTHLFGADLWGRRAAYALKIPVVTTEHGVNQYEHPFKHFLRRRESKKTEQYIAVSSFVKAYLVRSCGVDPGRIEIVHPGISVDHFSSVPDPSRDHVSILMIGRLSREKGFDIGVNALAMLKERQWQCTIVGDGDERVRLEKSVARHGLVHKIIFQPAIADVASVYSDASLVIVPSRWEGFGMVPLEAMASGRLVIGTKTGGMTDMLEDKKSGLIVDPGSVGQLTEAIAWALDHMSEVHKIGACARIRAREFDISRTVDAYVDIYEKIL